MQMSRSELWKNFRLGEELDVTGTFIYNGLRRFHELHKLDYSADLFEVFYQLSVGIERLMKIALVLLEHDDANDQDAFRSEEHTSELQSLMRISYAVFCLKKKTTNTQENSYTNSYNSIQT